MMVSPASFVNDIHAISLRNSCADTALLLFLAHWEHQMVPGLLLLQSTTPVTHWHLQLSQPQANHRPAVQHTTSAPGCLLTFSSCLPWQHLINYETNIIKFQWCCLFNKGGNTGTIHLLLGFGFPSMMEIEILFIKSIGLENILNCMIRFSSAVILTLLQLRNKFSLCFSVCSRLVLLRRPAVAARSVRTFGSLSSEGRMRAHSDALRPELIRCFVAEAHLLNHSVQSDGGSPGAQTEDTGGKEAQCGHKREAQRERHEKEREN